MWISRFDNEHLQATGAELGDSIFNVTGWSTTYVLITVIGLTGVRVGFLIYTSYKQNSIVTKQTLAFLMTSMTTSTEFNNS